MVHLLSSERPQLAAAPSWLRTLATWFAQAKANRARRLAYQELMAYDVARLDDLGINRQDLFEAVSAPSHRAGFRLAQRRAESSRLWLDP